MSELLNFEFRISNEELRRAADFFILHSNFELLNSSGDPSSGLRPPSPGGRRLSIAGLLLLFLFALPAAAQDLFPRFSVTGGMYRSTFSTDIRADSTPLQGTQINAERDLGLDRSKPLQRFTIQWRPFERHEIAAIYFSASRNGSREINTPIVFNGQVYPARAQVTRDIGGLAVDARLLARRPGQTVTITETASTNVPVALIGLQGRVAFTPSLFGELSGGVLPHVHIDVYSGRALTGSARLEYRILHNLALGVAYNYFRISGTVSDPQFGGDLAMTIDGAEGYLRLAFGR